MAPRRGGSSSSSSSSSSSIENQCAGSARLEYWQIQFRLTIYGIVLLGYLVLAFLSWRSSKKHTIVHKQNRILRWWSWALPLFLIIAFYIMAVVTMVLNSCYLLSAYSTDYNAVAISYSTIHDIAQTLIIGTILLAILPKLATHAAAAYPTILKIVSFVLLGLTTLFLVIFTILSSLTIFGANSPANSYFLATKLYATFAVWYLLAAILGSGFMAVTLVKLRDKGIARKGLTAPTTIVILSVIAFSFNNLIVTVLYDIYQYRGTVAGSSISVVVYHLTLFLVFLGIWLVSRAAGWSHSTTNTVYDPLNPVFVKTDDGDSQQQQPAVASPTTYPTQYQNAPQHQAASYNAQFPQMAYAGAGGWSQQDNGYQPVQQNVFAPPAVEIGPGHPAFRAELESSRRG